MADKRRQAGKTVFSEGNALGQKQHRGDMEIFYNMNADEEIGQPREGGGNR